MSEEWERVVYPRLTEIVKQLKPGIIIMRLLEKSVINEGEFRRLLNLIQNKSEEDCNVELLTNVLNKRGQNSVKEFVELLKETDQQHVANLLAQTQVEPRAEDKTKEPKTCLEKERLQRSSSIDVQTVTESSDVYMQSSSSQAITCTEDPCRERGYTLDREPANPSQVMSESLTGPVSFSNEQNHGIHSDQRLGGVSATLESAPTRVRATISRQQVNPWSIFNDCDIFLMVVDELRCEINLLSGLEEAKIVSSKAIQTIGTFEKREGKLRLLRDNLLMCDPSQFSLFCKVLEETNQKTLSSKLSKAAVDKGWNLPSTIGNTEMKLQSRRMPRSVVKSCTDQGNQQETAKQPHAFVYVYSKYRAQYNKEVQSRVENFIQQHIHPTRPALRPLVVTTVFMNNYTYDKDEGDDCKVVFGKRKAVAFRFTQVHYNEGHLKQPLLVALIQSEIPELKEDDIEVVGLCRNSLIYVITIPGDAALRLICLLKDPLPGWSLSFFGPVCVQFHGLPSIPMKFHLTDVVQTMLSGEFPVDSLVSVIQKKVTERAEIKLMLKEVCRVEMVLAQKLAALMSNLQQAKDASGSVATEMKHRALSESKKLMSILHDLRRANQVSDALVEFIDDLPVNTIEGMADDDVHGSLLTETVPVMARDDKSRSDKDLKSAVHEKTLQRLQVVTETDGDKLMRTADTSTSSAANKDGQAEFKAQAFSRQHKGKPLDVFSSLPPIIDEVRQKSAGLPQPGVYHVNESSGYAAEDTAGLTARECMIMPENGPQQGGTPVSIILSIDNIRGARVLWKSTNYNSCTNFNPHSRPRVPNHKTVVVNTPAWPRPEKVEVKVVDARDSTRVLGITEFEFTMNMEEFLRQEALVAKRCYEQLTIWKRSQFHDGGQTLHAGSHSSEEMRQVAECCTKYGRLANLIARLEYNSTVIDKRAPKITKKTNKQKRVASANRNIESSMSSTDSMELDKEIPKFRRHGCLLHEFYTEPETDECPANSSQQDCYRDTSLSEDDEKQQELKEQQGGCRERSEDGTLPRTPGPNADQDQNQKGGEARFHHASPCGLPE